MIFIWETFDMELFKIQNSECVNTSGGKRLIRTYFLRSLHLSQNSYVKIKDSRINNFIS